MGKHNHNHCLHELRYCEHCDTVYCIKCEREWGGHTHFYWTYGEPYRWFYCGTPYTVKWASTGCFTMTNSSGQTVDDTNIRSAFMASSDYTNLKDGSADYQSGVNTYCAHN